MAGNRIGDIGHAVQSYVEAQGYTVVRDFTGHGIGRKLHETPAGAQLRAPGRDEAASGNGPGDGAHGERGDREVDVLEDDWTAVTLDRKLSAHFEHTILITETAPRCSPEPGRVCQWL